jgi:hypothetical protein
LKDTLPLLFPVTLHHVNPRNNLGKKIFWFFFHHQLILPILELQYMEYTMCTFFE